MITDKQYAESIKGKIAELKFEKLLPNKENPFPSNTVEDFMVLGPFVMETGGNFETEFMYERHKTLECDYLESSGGEALAIPYYGASVKNNYYGNEYLSWKKSKKIWGCLRFANDDQGYDEALFLTEQRNCVYYAAVYINCDSESDAVICYENSGSLLYLNGVLIDNQPYGRVKGLKTTGHQVAVTFQKGKNLLLFKIRVGYIADTIDLSMSNCEIYPVIARSGNLGLTSLVPTSAYFGTKDCPRQMFTAFAGAFGDINKGILDYSSKDFSESIEINEIKNTSCGIVRLSVPSTDNESEEEIKISIKDGNNPPYKTKLKVITQPYNGFEGTEHIFSDFHFDTTYHQEQRVYALGAMHITKKIVDELERNPHFKAILSEVDYLHPFYSIYPHQREILKKMFVEGRAEADCFYNQPNELTSSGEGLVRNLIYGQFYHRDVLGRIVPVYSPGDVFGHPNQLSQICKKGGCTSANWGKVVIGLDSVFHHVSPDGTDIIHNKGINAKNSLRLGIKHCNQSTSSSSGFELYPREKDTSWMDKTLNNAKFSYFSDMMNSIIDEEKQEIDEKGISKIEYTARDLTPHHAGVLLTRTDFKQANRLGECLLITAEKFSSIAALYGANYPEKTLDKAWRQLICAQHHDSITGTNNEISFVDLMIEYREVVELAAEIIIKAASFLSSGVKLKSKELPIFVFNPLTWERLEPVNIILPSYAKDGHSLFDECGKEYAFTITGETNGGKSLDAVFIPVVPSMGYSVYYLKKSSAENKSIAGNDCEIENEYFKLMVDKNMGGGIISIFDKIEKKEVINTSIDGPANRVVVLREVPDRMETQHEFYTTGHKLVSSDYKAEVKSVKTNIFEKLIITYKLDIVARIKQEITLYKNVKRIDMNTVVEDYQGKDDLFTLTFPVNSNGAKPIYEDRFSPHVCGKGQKKLSFQTHQFFMYSHCQVAPTVNWLDLGPTTAISLTDANGIKGKINIGMTALIRAEDDGLIKASNKLLITLAKKAIPVTPYGDIEQRRDKKIIHFNEDLRNTDTRFVLSVDGIKNEYECKILNSLSSSYKNKFVNDLDTKGTAVLFLKDDDNLFNKSIDVILIKSQSIDELNKYIASISKTLKNNDSVNLDNIILIDKVGKADNYGVSIINKGTIASSVEPDNLINMMLFHTAEFYGNKGKTTGNSELVPEQKTHSFDYCLYPHQGSYREAGVFNKGMEFNDPLFSITDSKPSENNKFLPESKSFLKCSDNFIVTSFKAGGYPLASMKGNVGSIYDRGLSIRGFEPNGKPCEADFSFSFDAKKVCSVNLMEEEPKLIKHNNNNFTTNIGSHSIETFSIEIEKSNELIGKASIGAETEPVEPVYVRSYEHDLGSMPMGYYRVVGVIGRNIKKIGETEYVFEVSIANNQPDKTAVGKMVLSLPKDFCANKTEFKYCLKPNEFKVFPVTITKQSKNAKGIIRLNYSDDGILYEDIYEFGSFNPELRIKIEKKQIVATVKNKTDERLSGEISLATPFETWSVNGFNSVARGNIYPRTLKVDVMPNSEKQLAFPVMLYNNDIFNSYWAVAKLMVNGRIHFAYDRIVGDRHNMWTHIYFDEILNDGFSIKNLLEF